MENSMNLTESIRNDLNKITEVNELDRTPDWPPKNNEEVDQMIKVYKRRMTPEMKEELKVYFRLKSPAYRKGWLDMDQGKMYESPYDNNSREDYEYDRGYTNGFDVYVNGEEWDSNVLAPIQRVERDAKVAMTNKVGTRNPYDASVAKIVR
jgi:hypothetical protein